MRGWKWIEENFEGLLLVCMLSLMTLLIMMQIIMRYFFNAPLTWSEELCRMLLVWSGFLSIGYCARKGTTICLDTVRAILPANVQRILMNVTTILMIMLLGYLLVGSYRLVIDTARGNAVMAGLLIPQYWLYAVPMVGLALGLVRFMQCLYLTKFFSNVGKAKEEE